MLMKKNAYAKMSSCVSLVVINTEKDRKGPKQNRKNTEKNQKDTKKDRKDTEEDRKDIAKAHIYNDIPKRIHAQYLIN